MSGVIDQAPKIIREAARSPLGLLALVVLVLAVLAFLFFKDAAETVRLGIYLALLIGAALFSGKAFQIAAAGKSSSAQQRKIEGEQNRASEAGTKRIRVVPCHNDNAPFEVEAIAVEDDTLMVLSAGPDFRITHESVQQVISKARNAAPLTPGRIIVRPGRPLRLLAIVHDLSKEPTWTEQGIRQALVNILREAENRKLKAIAIPPLGTKHGSLEHERFVELFNEALIQLNPQFVEKVWFVVPEGFSAAAIRSLRQ